MPALTACPKEAAPQASESAHPVLEVVVRRAVEMVCPVHRAVRVAFLAHEAAVAALPLHPVSDWSAGWAGRAAWATRQAAGGVLLEHQAARLRQAGLPVKWWQAWDSS